MKFTELQQYAKMWGVNILRENGTSKELGEILFELSVVYANLSEAERTTCDTIMEYLEDS